MKAFCVEAGLQQVDELGVMIRREAGGSGGDRHGKTASGGANRGMAGILGGMADRGHGVIYPNGAICSSWRSLRSAAQQS